MSNIKLSKIKNGLILLTVYFSTIYLSKSYFLYESYSTLGHVGAAYNVSVEGRTETGADSTEQPLPSRSPRDAVWQPVAGTRFKFFVYSAYVEWRTSDAVRVIAATRTRGADAVVCRLWLPAKRAITIPASVKPIREHWNLNYTASYVLCSLRYTGVRTQDMAGAVVAVLADTAAHLAPTNLLPVLNTRPKPGIEERIHVCVKPFYTGNSTEAEDWLVEWFELNRLLGASHFYMYNESLSAPVACVLERYRREGLVTLLQWKLPLVSTVEIRTMGLFAALNDCLYRSMSSAGWLLLIDVDEVVLPRRERTLAALLTSLRASPDPSVLTPSAFLFRNAYFYLTWEDDVKATVPLLTARKTRRWVNLYKVNNRSKYMVRSRDAVELGNHFIWEFVPGARKTSVPTTRAVLHHYRAFYNKPEPSKIDRTAHRWSDELMQRVTMEKQKITKEGRTETGADSTEPPPPARAPRDAVWQPVAGTRFKFFVYSAYVEWRTSDAVRVIAATRTQGADAVVCRLWLPDNRTMTIPASVQPIREHWDLNYTASYVLCSLRYTGVRAQDTAGAVVAVLAEGAAHRAPTNLLPVFDTRPKPGIEEKLHVCVKPFYIGDSTEAEDWLVEWFELNRLLGASHFYMYNESLSAPVACVLERYRREGLVTLLQWKLPLVSRVEIRTVGSFAAFNDCLYRSMSSAGWLLLIDVDEVVLPRRERTLVALLTSLRASFYSSCLAPSAFLFRNALFYLRSEDDAKATVPLLTARKTQRFVTPNEIYIRSKYAVRPSDAVELGNHFIWELMPGANKAAVPTTRALLHHYRVIDLRSVPLTIDRTAHRWAEELMQRVTMEQQQITRACSNQ